MATFGPCTCTFIETVKYMPVENHKWFGEKKPIRFCCTRPVRRQKNLWRTLDVKRKICKKEWVNQTNRKQNMNLHTERAEQLLPTSLMNVGGQGRSSATATTATSALPSLHVASEDKDSIYTFSNDETDFMDHTKFGSRLSSTVMNTSFSSTTDKNLNDTRNSALKESIRTYSKKKASSSVSPRNNRNKKTPTLATNYSTTPSCSPLQSLSSSVPLSPMFSDESNNSQTQKSNGSAQTGTIYKLFAFH